MTGPHWLIGHPSTPDAVCILTESEYADLLKVGMPDGTIAEQVILVTLEEFLRRARAKT